MKESKAYRFVTIFIGEFRNRPKIDPTEHIIKDRVRKHQINDN